MIDLKIVLDMMNPGLAPGDPTRRTPRVLADQAYAHGTHLSPKTRTNALNG